MNWLLIIVVSILFIALTIFLIRRIIKDEKELENRIKDYPRLSQEKEDDFLINEVLK